MGHLRISTLGLGIIFSLLLVLLVTLKNELLAAHINGNIQYFSSDAANYFSLYNNLYAEATLFESPDLFLIGSPILFMKFVEGNIFVIQACNLLLMGVTLWVACECFATLLGRLTFVTGALVFPYFIFGFLSLNKEVYAMCGAIFFATYIARGKIINLIVALLLAACARYYMLIALLSLLALIPRNGDPKFGWILSLLVFTSLAAPIAKSLVPGYSSDGLLDVSGASGLIFATIIDHYGYGLVYPIKYLALIPQRAYGFLIGSDRASDGIEAIVSVASIVVVVLGCRILLTKRSASPIVWRLTIAGFVAPIAIMWSEIMHWRYFSFVYFFFLSAVVLHFIEGRRSITAKNAGPLHA
jgi:hypothetical protein